MVIATQNKMVSLNGMTVKRTQKIAEPSTADAETA